jgi:hypothetical protein
LSAEIERETIIYTNSQALYEKNEKAKSEVQSLKRSIREIEVIEKPKELFFEENIYQGKKKQALLYEQEQNTIKLLTVQEENRKERLAVLRENIESYVSSINKLNKLIDIFSPSGILQKEMEIKLDPIIKKFKKFIPGIEIKTLELLKNGLDSKEVFDIIVNGRNYEKLSTGEKMKIDVAISQIIDSMVKDQIGIYFLDNAESISEDIKINNQFFITKVTNTNLQIK